MKSFLLTLSSICATIFLHAQLYSGPIAAPTSGYGAWGSHQVDSIEFYNAGNGTDTSLIYYPQGTNSAIPTVFFLHGLNGESPAYCRWLLHFIASKGFACVFAPHDGSNAVMDYAQMYIGFTEAARNYPNIIDTTRVGFVGHSFGGSACYYISYDLFTMFNWGSNGRFLMPVASHYTLLISEPQLQTFPSATYLLNIFYDEDNVCDHRMGIDVFNHIGIPSADKDMVLVRSSQYQSYSYQSSHTALNTTTYDALDAYVVFRLLDALMDLTFNQNNAARNVCLGDGSVQQISMPPGLQSLVVSDTLSAWHAEGSYGYPCSVPGNPRYMYCGIPTVVPGEEHEITVVTPYSDFICIKNVNPGTTYCLVNALGQVIAEDYARAERVEISIAYLPSGLYVLQCGATTYRFMK